MPHNEHEKPSLASLQRWGIIAAPMSPWNHNDTMAALATAPGAAGLAVIRISGPESLAVADRVFACAGRKPSQRPTHTVVAGRVLDGAEVIDEALLLIMRAPRSYTREDVVEIQCHGGQSISRRVLRCVLAAGARPAEPGEFTRRAFLSGRLDLVQAEAVNDLIRARSDRSARSALEQLEGRLSLRFNGVYDRLIQGASAMEAALDFPDDELPPPVVPDVLHSIELAANDLRDLLATWDEGHCLRDGLLVVIAGRPNVGKSTLMNALLGRERSIVSEIPGTTRDTIEESFVLRGVQLILVDTAGLRDSSCTLEREGIRRARHQLSKADLYLYVVDASQPLQSEDQDNLKNMPNTHCLIVGNKIDLGRKLDVSKLSENRYCDISVTHNIGMEELKNKLYEIIEKEFHLGQDAGVFISERHRDILAKVLPQVEKAIELLREGSEEAFVLVVSHLRAASELVGFLTGKEYNESLLESIFSKFCIGK